MRNKNKMQLLILALSVMIGGAGTFLYAGRVAQCSPAPMALMALWGGVYPEYCLSGAVEAVEEEADSAQETEKQVRIRFKYLTFLND